MHFRSRTSESSALHSLGCGSVDFCRPRFQEGPAGHIGVRAGRSPNTKDRWLGMWFQGIWKQFLCRGGAGLFNLKKPAPSFPAAGSADRHHLGKAGWARGPAPFAAPLVLSPQGQGSASHQPWGKSFCKRFSLIFIYSFMLVRAWGFLPLVLGVPKTMIVTTGLVTRAGRGGATYRGNSAFLLPTAGGMGSSL